MKHKKALIVGGGIGGLTAAAALSRAGVSCDVIDITDRPLGAAITLLNRAVDALAEIGVLEQCLENGTETNTRELFAHFDAAGAPIATPPMPHRPASDLPEGILIYRPILAKILRAAAENAGADVRIGVSISGLVETPDAVVASLTDGTEQSYDLIVGADGVRSPTRSLILENAVSPTYSGVTMFRWVADGIPDVGPTGHYLSDHLCVTRRMRDGRIYVATGRKYPERPRLAKAERRQILGEILRTFTAPLIRALEERLTDEADIILNDYDWLLAPKPWFRGRVLLIGDAAHATTAHLASGGGMAMEDGVVLGQEFAAGETVQEAFARFMDRRFERARLVVESSVQLDKMLQRGESSAAQNEVRARAMAALAAPY